MGQVCAPTVFLVPLTNSTTGKSEYEQKPVTTPREPFTSPSPGLVLAMSMTCAPSISVSSLEYGAAESNIASAF